MIIQNENTKFICDLFPFVIFKREILMDVYRAEVTFIISIIGERDLFSLVLLFVLYYWLLGFKRQQ